MYFRGRLLKSFPLSGTDILLQSDRVLSSKFVLNLEIGAKEFPESAVVLLEYPSGLLAVCTFDVFLTPNSFCVRDRPCDASEALEGAVKKEEGETTVVPLVSDSDLLPPAP